MKGGGQGKHHNLPTRGLVNHLTNLENVPYFTSQITNFVKKNVHVSIVDK